MDLGQVVPVAASAVIAGGGLFTIWRKWLRPALRNLVRFFGRVDETINGRPADVDAWGHERAPAVPSLGERMTSLEDAVRDQASFDQRLTDVEHRVTAIESGHQVERVVTKLESTAAWNAVEAIASQPGDAVDEISD